MKYITVNAINNIKNFDYLNNQPFPHIVIDEFFKKKYLYKNCRRCQ